MTAFASPHQSAAPAPAPAGNPYLRTKVQTASPEQLRMMLIEGAIKFSRQGRHALSQHDFEGMYNGLSRTQKIVLELANSLNRAADPELCDRLSALYTYIYRRLIDANMERDLAAIDEVIDLLEYERETWALALKKLSDARENGEDPVAEARAKLPAPPEASHPREVPNPIATIGRPAPGMSTAGNPFAKSPAAPSGGQRFTAQA